MSTRIIVRASDWNPIRQFWIGSSAIRKLFQRQPDSVFVLRRAQRVALTIDLLPKVTAAAKQFTLPYRARVATSPQGVGCSLMQRRGCGSMLVAFAVGTLVQEAADVLIKAIRGERYFKGGWHSLCL
jgi:hypothetical protein